MASNKQQGKQQKLTAKQKGERVRAAQEREARAKELPSITKDVPLLGADGFDAFARRAEWSRPG